MQLGQDVAIPSMALPCDVASGVDGEVFVGEGLQSLRSDLQDLVVAVFVNDLAYQLQQQVQVLRVEALNVLDVR